MESRKKCLCHCINLRRAANSVTLFYDPLFQPFDRTANQFSLLRNIGELDGCSTTRLAQTTGLDRTTLVRNLQPLLKCGLVRNDAAAGTRDHCLRLTEEGTSIMLKALEKWEEAQQQVAGIIGEDRLKDFYLVLSKLEMLR